MFGSSREEYSQQLSRLLAHAGYPPAFIEVVREGAVSVWYWVGATTIQISREFVSDVRELANEIALEAHRRGVLAARD